MRTAAYALLPLLLALPALGNDGHARATLSVVGDAKPGATVEVQATLEVEKDWHVYGTKTENGQATTLELSLPPGVTLDGPLKESPAPHPEEIEYVGKVLLHRGTVTFSQALKIAADAKLPLSLPAKVVWQACDDQNTMCVSGEQAATLALGEGGAPAGGDVAAVTSEPKVEVSVSLAPAAGGGQRADLVVELVVPQGWHIYATHSPQGLPTSLQLTLPAGVTKAGPLQEPEAHPEHIEGFGEVHIYGGAVRLVQPLLIAPEAFTSPIQGVVAWQVCDDGNSIGCY
jgi:DsbC/DsbD-like thiol-disulfide interchange protein